MNKRILFNYFLLFSIFAWMMACDRIKKDDLPEPAQAKTLITSAKTPILQDLTKLHNLSQPATFNLVDTTQWGKAEFVQAGLLMYTPKDDASDVKDTVNYQVCVDGNCKQAILTIQVLAKGTSPKPGDICEQGAFSDIVSLVLPNNQLTIKVLENDTICNAFLEPDSLRITIAPPLGTASVKNGEIIYQINPSQFSGGEIETFIYQVSEKGNPNNIKYAAVKVNVLAKPCELAVNNDEADLTLPNNQLIIKVLENDNFCNTPVEFTNFQLTNLPTLGIATITGNVIIYQIDPTKFVGGETITFGYQVAEKDKPDNIKNAIITVHINPSACELITQNDVINLTLPNNQLIIKVLANDNFCNTPVEFVNFQLTSLPTLGTTSIQGNEIVYQIDPTKFVGDETITFTYQVAEKDKPNNIKTATVKVYINPGNCDLIVRNDSYQVAINFAVWADILQNDNYCKNLWQSDTLEAVKILIPPSHGNLQILSINYDIFIYRPNLDYEGNDQFNYQVKYQDGTTKQGIVNIAISGGISCLNAPPQAKNDGFTYRNIDITPQVYLPIFNNDVICYPALDYSKITITQDIPSNQGTLTKDIYGNIIYTLPSPTFTGTVVFKYQICDKYNRCSEATVTLNITN